MNELLKLIEQECPSYSVRAAIGWDESCKAFSVTVHWTDQRGNRRELNRKVWPIAGFESAIKSIASEVTSSLSV